MHLNPTLSTLALGGLGALLLVACGQPFRDILPTPPPDSGAVVDAKANDAGTAADTSTTNDAEAKQDAHPDAEPDVSWDPTKPPGVPGPLVLKLRAPKMLALDWNDVPGAEFYRVFEAVDGTTGFHQTGDELKISSFEHSVPLWSRVGASYVVQACNAAGCSEYSEPAKTSDGLVDGIGYFKASNPGPGDAFGHAVAISADGTTLAVGVPAEDSPKDKPLSNELDGAGTVYVYAKLAGTWQFQFMLKASNPDAADGFGQALAISADGNTIAVGAAGEDSNARTINGNQLDNSLADSGAAYVFVRQNGNWTQAAYVKASNSERSDRFGSAVALSDDATRLAVGAPDRQDNGTYYSGGAYVFLRKGNQWSQEAFLRDPANARRELGRSLAFSSDATTLAAGVPGRDVQGQEEISQAGGIAVFYRANSSWSFGGLADDPSDATVEEGSGLGAMIAISANGMTMVGHAPANNTLIIYRKEAGRWRVHREQPSSYPFSLSGDGSLIAIHGSTSNATCVGGDLSAESSQDAVLLYQLSFQGELVPRGCVKSSNPAKYDGFGTSVALSRDGSTMAVGAPSEDGASSGIGGDQQSDATENAGAVYLY